MRKAPFFGHRTWGQSTGQAGPADALLVDLLVQEPTIVSRAGTVVLTDPARLAQAVVEVRGECAAEWTSDLALVREEHLKWRRWLLERTM